MNWQQLYLEISKEQATLIEEVLMGLGALSIDMSDPKDSPIYEPPAGTTPLWESILLKALFDEDCDSTNITHYLRDEFTLSPQWELVPDTNWQEECNKNFSLTQFGEKLWICPSWEEVGDITGEVIRLDPGMAFGTGAHETTHLCLHQLTKESLEHKTVLDFGCGSGVLAIAAKKLGAQTVVAIDTDPQALEASLKNAKHNNVTLDIMYPHELEDTTFDIIIANILATTLIELYPTIHSLVQPGGIIILSGILSEQVNSVIQCYAIDFTHITTEVRGDWTLLRAHNIQEHN